MNFRSERSLQDTENRVLAKRHAAVENNGGPRKKSGCVAVVLKRQRRQFRHRRQEQTNILARFERQLLHSTH